MVILYLILSMLTPELPVAEGSLAFSTSTVVTGTSVENEIHFIENSEQFQSLEEVVGALNGKKVYVDIWATWCGPCIEEFEHNEKLQELAREHDFDILYLSVDEPRREQQWKAAIQHFNLKGYHLLVNPALEKQLRALFNNGGGVQIPWYMIFDEEAKLAKVYAPRPSELKALARNMKKL
ncbi:TlpA family protein disulfide reductase [Flavilitoribacter nigricans]|uniref:Thioredoxin domain-containing protein n=1 Tax=Flavilitoribacter nigricans (strain ATCC 23147 / DSM 23189 / NBRC 102662 / NCIMB 1420 / SS-2) TaxID=1122177 RepID=A0A2D0N0H3_FLAN2|nr:TlpA disulfide reductase family protein [Flavilitoribacter nigricans]PHN02052.1 hypothetical protein CRP01_34015 [Flavilitoribacter nigricans DSM 23189 = NBRC 102662]